MPLAKHHATTKDHLASIITATRNTTTINVKTTKVLSGTTTTPEDVPKKQKCEAQKVYLDGTGWLELTRKVSTKYISIYHSI